MSWDPNQETDDFDAPHDIADVDWAGLCSGETEPYPAVPAYTDDFNSPLWFAPLLALVVGLIAGMLLAAKYIADAE